MPVARFSPCEIAWHRGENGKSGSSGSMGNSARCRYGAVIFLYSTHTGTICKGTTTTAVRVINDTRYQVVYSSRGITGAMRKHVLKYFAKMMMGDDG